VIWGGVLPATDGASERIALLDGLTDFATFGPKDLRGGAGEVEPHNILHDEVGTTKPPFNDRGASC
jgi:hypothetical protein